jgi:hypothetical protein
MRRPLTHTTKAKGNKEKKSRREGEDGDQRVDKQKKNEARRENRWISYTSALVCMDL